jgi:uncharacterized protein (TIGR02147 family)
MSFREILHQEWLRRRQVNAGYSMRAFARDLRVSPSRLCEVMKSQQSFTRRTAEKIVERLSLPKSEAEHFFDLVDAENKFNPSVRKAAQKKLSSRSQSFKANSKPLADTQLEILSEHTYAQIYEALDLDGCPKDFERQEIWLAKLVGVNRLEVFAALRRLRSSKLIEIKNGRYVKRDVDRASVHEISSATLRKIHSCLISQSLIALNQQSVDERFFNSLCLSFDQSRLNEAKQDLREFIAQFNAKYGHGPKKNATYAFTTQFFRLLEDRT